MLSSPMNRLPPKMPGMVYPFRPARPVNRGLRPALPVKRGRVPVRPRSDDVAPDPGVNVAAAAQFAAGAVQATAAWKTSDPKSPVAAQVACPTVQSAVAV